MLLNPIIALVLAAASVAYKLRRPGWSGTGRYAGLWIGLHIVARLCNYSVT